MIRKKEFSAAFGTNGDALWTLLIEQGRIVPDGHLDAGHLMPGDPNARPDRFDGFQLDVETVERGLHALAKSINDTQRRALYRGRPVARDGWLELRPDPNADRDFLEPLETTSSTIDLDGKL